MARLLGVLGGMGPLATSDFYAKLVAATPAQRDQEHVPVLILSDPRIPDRAQAIRSGQEDDVLQRLLQGLDRLKAADVEGVAMPCNTAHHWLDALQARSSTPIIPIQIAVIDQLASICPTPGVAAVLATEGTLDADVYGPALRAAGWSIATLTLRERQEVTTVIGEVKAGRVAAAQGRLSAILDALPPSRADVIVLACTELPVALAAPRRSDPRLLDATDALAKACVRWSFGA